MHGTHQLVGKHTLVVVHVAGIVRIKGIEVLGEFGQVVGAAGFVDFGIREQIAPAVALHAGVHAHHLGVRLAEHFSVSYAAHGINVSALHQFPEVAGNVVVSGFSAHLVALEGAHNHGNVLVGVTGANVVDILGQGLVEGRRVKVAGGFGQALLLRRVAYHGAQAGEGFLHAAHFSGNVHVPHFVAVAGPGLAFGLGAFGVHVSAIVEAVPYPQAHVLGNEQGFGGNGFVVYVVGNVNEAGQLFVDGIIRGPHTALVVVGGVFFYQRRMLGGNGVNIAVTVFSAILLILVEGFPGAFHLRQFGLGSQIAGFTVAAQGLVIDKGKFLAGAQFVHHPPDIGLEGGLQLRILRTGIGEGQGAHVVAGAMAFELGGGAVPAVTLHVAFCGKAVGVPIII